jgi:hypothetical protein
VVDYADFPGLAGHLDLQAGMHAITVAEPYAYLGGWQIPSRAYRFWVADVSNPDDAALVGSHELSDRVGAIAVAGGVAYLALRSQGLLVFDVSDPTNPSPLAIWQGSEWVEDVAAVGDVIYVCGARNGLFVLDVSDPAEPVVVARDPDRRAMHVLLSGSRLITSGTGTIYDVSDPFAPVRIGWTASNGHPVALDGDHLFVLENFAYEVSEVEWHYDSSLEVIDVSDPMRPRQAGRLRLAGGTSATSVDDAILDGDRLIVSGSRGLYVLDVADPTAPTVTHRVRTKAAPARLARAGDRILAGSRPGLDTYDLDHADLPHWVGDDSGNVIAHDVASSGPSVYTLSRSAFYSREQNYFATTLRSYELGRAGNLELLAEAYYGYGYADKYPLELGRDLEVSGGDLYTSRPVLYRFPLESDTRPGEPMSVPGFDRANDTEAIGPDRLAVGTGEGLFVFDTSPAGDPTLLASNTEHAIVRMAADRGLICALEQVGGETTLHVVDGRNPAEPRFVGALGLGAAGGSRGWLPWVTLRRTLAAAVPREGDEVRLLDLTDPTRPREVSTFPVAATSRGGTMSGDVLYVATDLGCVAVDVRDPGHPRVLGRASTDAIRAVLRHRRLLLTCEGARLSVLPRDRREAHSTSLAPADHLGLVIAPNPFRNRVTAHYRQPPGAGVVAEVFDARGRYVRRLVGLDGSVIWDGRTANGSHAAAGVYFLRLEAGGRQTVEKIVRIR